MYVNLFSLCLILDYCRGASIANSHAQFVKNAEMARTCHDLVYYPKYLDQIIEPIKSCLNFTTDNRIVIPDAELEAEEKEEEKGSVAIVLTEESSDSELTVLETLQELVKYIYLEFHIHRLESEQENQMYRCSWVKLELVQEDGYVNKTTYRALFSNETEPLSSELLKQLEACPTNVTVPEFRLCMESVCMEYLGNSWFTPIADITTTEGATTVTTESTPLQTVTTTELDDTTVTATDAITETHYNQTTTITPDETTIAPENETTTTSEELGTMPDALLAESQTEQATESTSGQTKLAPLQQEPTTTIPVNQDSTGVTGKETTITTIQANQDLKTVTDKETTMQQVVTAMAGQASTVLQDQTTTIVPMEQVTEVLVAVPGRESTISPDQLTTVAIRERTVTTSDQESTTSPDKLTTVASREMTVSTSDQESTISPDQQTTIVPEEEVTENSITTQSQQSTASQDQPKEIITKTANPKEVFQSTTSTIEDQTSGHEVTTLDGDI